MHAFFLSFPIFFFLFGARRISPPDFFFLFACAPRFPPGCFSKLFLLPISRPLLCFSVSAYFLPGFFLIYFCFRFPPRFPFISRSNQYRSCPVAIFCKFSTRIRHDFFCFFSPALNTSPIFWFFFNFILLSSPIHLVQSSINHQPFRPPIAFINISPLTNAIICHRPSRHNQVFIIFGRCWSARFFESHLCSIRFPFRSIPFSPIAPDTRCYHPATVFVTVSVYRRTVPGPHRFVFFRIRPDFAVLFLHLTRVLFRPRPVLPPFQHVPRNFVQNH